MGELPARVHKGQWTPLVDGTTYNSIHEFNCSLKICRDSFGVKLCRCPPYAMIIGRQKQNVSNAILYLKNALKMFEQSQLVRPQEVILPPSRLVTLLDSNAANNKKPPPKPRIITIPQWLVSDASFQRRIQDGIFGHD